MHPRTNTHPASSTRNLCLLCSKPFQLQELRLVLSSQAAAPARPTPHLASSLLHWAVIPALTQLHPTWPKALQKPHRKPWGAQKLQHNWTDVLVSPVSQQPLKSIPTPAGLRPGYPSMPQADVSWSHSTVGAFPRSITELVNSDRWFTVTLKRTCRASERSALLLLLCFSMNDLNDRAEYVSKSACDTPAL